MTQIYCWRCEEVPVRLYGLPCPACRVRINAEYDAQVAANGGKLLYLPDDWCAPLGLFERTPITSAHAPSFEAATQ